ncbi:MAG: phosphoribosylaminoimidazolesuccinocarboxamide synthase [Burkholderiales bacterium]|jgi:phosphoribosylaminoimidazole-succinocarboxamide synthase|nr:phosphoribosylaminoimidazolesuccinocarboxamide synthase [Burkholderiales bacterium]
MPAAAALSESHLQSLRLLHRGKVRDLYEIDAARLLVIQTDRLSAFDVILPTPVPGKGRVLTAVSNFWFAKLAHVIPNHLLPDDPADFVRADERDQVDGRAFVVRRLAPLPIEAIVRGYVAGSGWKEYRASGSICGIALPPGLLEAAQLPAPIFTPSTKAAVGGKDENIAFAEVERLLGAARAAEVRDVAIRLYSEAAVHAATRGLLIADTKFEFGTDADGRLWLIDEALTPDSSRFWPRDAWQPGTSPPSFDKQFVRDWLEAQPWDKRPPGPVLPDDIVQRTAQKYEDALRRLTA